MTLQNFDFLKDRLYFLGFGEHLNAALEQKMKSGEQKFTLGIQAEFKDKEGKVVEKTIDYKLDFSKSKDRDMFFLNNYQATLKNLLQGKTVTQKFFLQKGAGMTALESINMLEGRAVFKKNLVNRDQESYQAWSQLDLTKKDDKGNHKFMTYNKSYNRILEEDLNKLPIKEVGSAKAEIIRSLEKGNQPQVTFMENNKELVRYLEANPKQNNLLVYDENMNKLEVPQLQREMAVQVKNSRQASPIVFHITSDNNPPRQQNSPAPENRGASSPAPDDRKTQGNGVDNSSPAPAVTQSQPNGMKEPSTVNGQEAGAKTDQEKNAKQKESVTTKETVTQDHNRNKKTGRRM